MNMEQIKSVIALMKDEGLDEFAIEEDGFKLSLKRRGAAAAVPAAHAAAAPAPAAAAPAAPSPAPAPAQEEGEKITAPLVGTFYRASSPDADPFVKVGSTVTKDTVVGIIEAMKVMNEIKAETSGVIKKVLVDNAMAVQYGQPLFLVGKA
ncbi:MAG: acetyl-CoA carboxylase biotin carboxyl carrier protein [Kiritimatiellae bacterium]|nr:acetyl-CoA carboxylase biotin carboxyl carrier protein [Kiritimatiellia bacterium]